MTGGMMGAALTARRATTLGRGSAREAALATLAAHPMSGRVADADLDVVWLVLVNARSMAATR